MSIISTILPCPIRNDNDFTKVQENYYKHILNLSKYNEVFEKLYQLLEPLLSKDDNRSSISLFDEFLMVLVKLRLGVPSEALGYRFHVSSTQVSVIFRKWITLVS